MTEKEMLSKYREILISPIKECASYIPKFGHSKSGGFSFSEFQKLYGADLFYKWLGLDSALIYSAHKAAGGITSIYRQIGIGCERLVREIFKDKLFLSDDDVKWSYKIPSTNGKERVLSLDARILLDKIKDENAKANVEQWMHDIAKMLDYTIKIENAMQGIVFEVRQGYKSKDSKRQNADIANAANAYANGYIPCLMVMSAQIDDDNVMRYRQAKWAILRGIEINDTLESTYEFFNKVIGFDFVKFMSENQRYLQKEIHSVLENLMRA